jgi:chaperone BCS1
VIQFFSGLFKNPVVEGVIAVMISGAVMYMFKSLPIKVYSFLLRRITITLAVTGEDKAFDLINVWLSQQSFSEKSRNLKFFSIGSATARLAPGFGEHVFWDGNVLPIFVRRVQDDKVNSGAYTIRPKETIYLTVFGRSHKKILDIIEKIEKEQEKNKKDKIRLYVTGNYGYWTEIETRSKRPLDRLFIPEELKTEIFDHAKWFCENESWYLKRGVPYRMGYLFYGPPGTGKTSAAITMASVLDRPLYLLNPFSSGSEQNFSQAFSNVPRNAIVLIEDADVLEPPDKSNKNKKKNDKEEDNQTSPVSMSAVLNAIDGACSIEGRILVMTTNHIEKLRPALIRSGRIDKKFEIGLMKPAEVGKMASAFFGGGKKLLSKIKKDALNGPLRSGAEWQQEFIMLKG